MTRKHYRYLLWGILAAIAAVMLWGEPGQAHWADLATAEITLEAREAKMTLTYPTRLTNFADDDGDGQLSTAELNRHAPELRQFFSRRIVLKDGQDHPATLDLQPLAAPTATSQRLAPDSHTTLQLVYAWAVPPAELTMTYTLFSPDDAKASCLVTVSQAGQFTTHVLTPSNPTWKLLGAETTPRDRRWAITLMGAFLWGAVHSLSPGHGKTLVGAYLVGERATSRQAIFLALTTTLAHTLGIFLLGLVALAATQYILPEQIYPWLSLVSGGLIILVGANLVRQRSLRYQPASAQEHAHSPHHHHGHSHHHDHDHLPVTTDGKTCTWRRLLVLGLSAGLVPCPAALVLLLGAIALGKPVLAVLLVVSFSLGLAIVLTGLGLLLVSAKGVFKRLPTARLVKFQWLPLASAVSITLIGLGISTRSVLQLL